MTGSPLIIISGPTATGKSALGVRLAKEIGGEIISADSMQVYRHMDIGTAKISVEEMDGVPHHMIDIADPTDDFSAGDYAEAAGKIINDIVFRGKHPIMCGGTFMYLDTLTAVSSLSEATKDEALRRELGEYAEKNGAASLHKMLEEIDPEAAEAIHENNIKRVIRAIEIYRTTGKTKSEWDALSKEKEAPFRADRIIIDYNDREILYDRINRRVDIMMEQGLEKEARTLFDKGLLSDRYCASQAIGYKEFIPYFNGETTLESVIDEIKQSSRNYAKRQLTWLRRYKDAIVLTADEGGKVRSVSSLADEALEKLKTVWGKNK